MIKPILPPKINPGDTIAIVAASEPVEREDIAVTKTYLENLGYKVKLGKHLFYKIGNYTAGTIEDRALDMNTAFADPDIKAIFMGLGGYAADQILDLLDYDTIAKNPKIFCGYSDATILQLAMLAKTGLVTFSGPNGAGLGEDPEYTKERLWEIFSGKEIEKVSALSNWEVLRSGKGKGMLIGGNLDTMCAIFGTQYDPFYQLRDEKVILFWEEYEDSYSQIIRNLFHLKNIGVFEHCEGMVVGHLTKCSEEGAYIGVPELRYVLLQMARAFDFPIMWNVDFGHEVPKMTIPIGVYGEIDTKSLTLKFKPALS